MFEGQEKEKLTVFEGQEKEKLTEFEGQEDQKNLLCVKGRKKENPLCGNKTLLGENPGKRLRPRSTFDHVSSHMTAV